MGVMCKNGPNKNATIVKLSNAILGAGLSAMACSASALSLGASHGTVVLGAPLDLVFDVQPDPGGDVASSCVRVRIVSGETPIADSKVQVEPMAPAAGRGAGVRVRAFITVDEPVVTATVVAGCSGGVTRHYTFLSQLPDSAAASSSRLVDIGQLAGAAPAASVPRRPAPAAAGGGQEASGSLSLSSAVPSSPRTVRPRPAASAAAARVSRAPAPALPVASASPAADRARLVMEPLDVWLESPLPLRTSPELPTATAPATAEQRAEAAALWKALNTPVEEMQRAAARAGQLEASVATERARAASERAAAAELRQRLESAESDSFPTWLGYGLLGLLAVLLAAIAWLWSRARRAGESAWTQAVAASGQPQAPGGVVTKGPGGRDALQVEPQPADDWASAPQSQPPASRATPRAPGPAAPVTRPAPPPAEPTTVPARATAPMPAGPAFPTFADSLSGAIVVEGPTITRRAPPPPKPAAPRASAPMPLEGRSPGAHPEDLFDIQQQAEFFVSVGEHEQAIAVLKQHIAAHGDTSAFAYLELLRLYHTLGRVENFNQLRDQFHAQFNAFVPEFSAFHRSGRTLQGFPEALAEIEAEWSSPAVLGIIEGYLFRQSDMPDAPQFDLAAYDDLLLLLAIAQTTPASARGPAPPRSRTTPDEVPGDEVLAAQPALPASSAGAFLAKETGRDQELRSLDSLSAGLEWESLPTPLPPPPAPAPEPPPDSMLDIDLTDPPHLTLSDLPPVPVTAPPSSGEPVGFGMDNDKLELRLELEEIQRKHKPGE